MAGIASMGIKLNYKTKTVTTLTEIANVMDVPEIGGKPEKIDVTVLTDTLKKSIFGVKDMGDLEFTLLFDNSTETSNYRVLKALEVAKTLVSFEISYPDGTKQAFDAYINVSMNAAKVNEAITFKMSCALQSEITTTNPTP
ncbi:phage tail tube protein [Clostridium gasigenes]|uniref:Phage tail protein n=1 Tax=Clostridium gasigenes TaxID=94869 RepID=A0A7X0SEZ8_9CLOT|nr:phage tail tube protein [Clostridium gasigenes]MBB6716367.1 phage tail protein [Clostridium gasigenes]